MKYSLCALWEINYPKIISILFLIILINFGGDNILDFDKLIGESISVFGILLGFFITIITLINTMDNQYMRVIRSNNETFGLLKKYLKNVIWLTFYTIILGLIYEFILINCSFPFKDVFQIIIFFFNILTIISSYRFIKLFLLIIIP